VSAKDMKIQRRIWLEPLAATAAKLYEREKKQTWMLGLIKYGRLTILSEKQKASAQLSST
jgi:hypothetical protein